MAKPKEDQMRVEKVDGSCSRECCYYLDCGEFRTREKRCPRWATNSTQHTNPPLTTEEV